jgi:hypothetical protein
MAAMSDHIEDRIHQTVFPPAFAQTVFGTDRARIGLMLTEARDIRYPAISAYGENLW